MNTENFHIMISVYAEGVSWKNTLISEYDIQALPHEAFSRIAEELTTIDITDLPDGAWVNITNQNNERETFRVIPAKNGKCNIDYVTEGIGFGSEYGDYSEKKFYLVCLDEEKNLYQSYTMYQEEDNVEFGVNFGRLEDIDYFNSNTGDVPYDPKTQITDFRIDEIDSTGLSFMPSAMFWINYHQMLREGYYDITEELDFRYGGRLVKSTEEMRNSPELTNYAVIEEAETRQIVEDLIVSQKQYTQQRFDYFQNRLEFSTSLNQTAIKNAETLLDYMSQVAIRLNALRLEENVSENVIWHLKKDFIEIYKELLTTLPRKVDNIKEYVGRVDFNDPDSIAKIIDEERKILNALAEVKGLKTTEPAPVKSECTVLENYGLSAETADFTDKFDILQSMPNDAYKVSDVLAIRNEKTTNAYEACKREMGIDDKFCRMLWHGSRTENWWSILKDGLLLDAKTIATGKSYGQGLYFAPTAEDAIKFSEENGYVAMYEVAFGNPYVVREPLGNEFTVKSLKKGYDSVLADLSGNSHRSDEYIIYRQEQCNMRYLVKYDENREKMTLDISEARKLKFTDFEYDSECKEIFADIPNFKAHTGIAIGGVTVTYEIEDKNIRIVPIALAHALGETDKELVSELFMSKLADNKREFERVVQDIQEQGKIPDDVEKRIQRINKGIGK